MAEGQKNFGNTTVLEGYGASSAPAPPTPCGPFHTVGVPRPLGGNMVVSCGVEYMIFNHEGRSWYVEIAPDLFPAPTNQWRAVESTGPWPDVYPGLRDVISIT